MVDVYMKGCEVTRKIVWMAVPLKLGGNYQSHQEDFRAFLDMLVLGGVAPST